MSEPNIIAGVNITPFDSAIGGDALGVNNYWYIKNAEGKEIGELKSRDYVALLVVAADREKGLIAQLRKVEALEAAQAWTAVDDGLPEDGQFVLAAFSAGRVFFTRFYAVLPHKWFVDGFSSAETPTHWMRLPAPPAPKP